MDLLALCVNIDKSEGYLFNLFLTLTAFSVVYRNNTAAFCTCIHFFLLLYKYVQSMLANKLTIFHEACLIPLVVAFSRFFISSHG